MREVKRVCGGVVFDALLLSLIISQCFVTSEAFGVDFKRSSQDLPPKCWEQFERVATECPSQDLPKDKLYWSKLSAVCCGSYPRTTLHCQQSYTDTGSLAIFPACLTKTTVPMGHYGVLRENASGYPEFTTQPCGSDSYEDVDRPSDRLYHPYCTKHKTNCGGEGQQLFCRGGPSEDNRCVCGEGFRTAPDSDTCRRGHFQDGGCTCVREECPQGRTRNISDPNADLSCDDLATEPDYSCYDRVRREPASATTVQKTTTRPSVITSRPPSPAPGDGGNGDSDDTEKTPGEGFFDWRLFVGLTVILIALVAVVVVVVWCTCKRRICRVLESLRVKIRRETTPAPPPTGAAESLL